MTEKVEICWVKCVVADKELLSPTQCEQAQCHGGEPNCCCASDPVVCAGCCPLDAAEPHSGTQQVDFFLTV